MRPKNCSLIFYDLILCSAQLVSTRQLISNAYILRNEDHSRQISEIFVVSNQKILWLSCPAHFLSANLLSYLRFVSCSEAPFCLCVYIEMSFSQFLSFFYELGK